MNVFESVVIRLVREPQHLEPPANRSPNNMTCARYLNVSYTSLKSLLHCPLLISPELRHNSRLALGLDTLGLHHSIAYIESRFNF
ncbi:hypothetical protein BN1723_012194 [Verticillium longisporum]|uniref:Uncharacterized protein n=1 Tax=Verticillium longisporum TaxID=100787 RepID=A0A0G4LG62_VERLO|nr:hypothetical protein BN1723_012194 [Verticillium longisporum]